jgi:hypothetical protein
MEEKRVKLFCLPSTICVAALMISLGAWATNARAQASIELRVEPVGKGQYNVRYHILRADTPAGRSAPLESAESLAAEAETANPEFPAVLNVPPPGFYEGDVTATTGAKTLSLNPTVFNAMFVSWTGVVNCPNGTCWGNPNVFMTDSAKASSFICQTNIRT